MSTTIDAPAGGAPEFQEARAIIAEELQQAQLPPQEEEPQPQQPQEPEPSTEQQQSDDEEQDDDEYDEEQDPEEGHFTEVAVSSEVNQLQQYLLIRHGEDDPYIARPYHGAVPIVGARLDHPAYSGHVIALSSEIVVVYRVVLGDGPSLPAREESHP